MGGAWPNVRKGVLDMHTPSLISPSDVGEAELPGRRLPMVRAPHDLWPLTRGHPRVPSSWTACNPHRVTVPAYGLRP